MGFVFDVDYATFKKFKRNDLVFFWAEESDKFVLVKIANEVNVRCIVMKDSNEKNDMFKLRELFNYSGIYCKRITWGNEEKSIVPNMVFDINDTKIGKSVEMKRRGKK